MATHLLVWSKFHFNFILNCMWLFSYYILPIEGVAFHLNGGEDASSLLSREEEFGFDVVEFEHKEYDIESPTMADSSALKSNQGIVCTSSSDEVYLQRWGAERFRQRYAPHGIHSIWEWNHKDSGILPCSVYLRHVYLAAQSAGPEVLQSLLDETFLVDRTTTIRQYLDLNPDVLLSTPPESLMQRYNGWNRFYFYIWA